MIVLLIWLSVLLAVVGLYLNKTFSKFSNHGVKYITPVPFLGNLSRLVFKKDHLAGIVQRLYDRYPDERFVGHWDFMNPLILIRDVELIKQLAVKDFESFLNHRVILDEKSDPFFGNNLFALRGQKWKDMRSTLSPAFTSSKIRLMVPFMVEVGDQMIDSLNRSMKEKNVDNLDVDIKDLATRYANDVIASCAFGLKVDSHVEKENQFYAKGKAFSQFTFFQFMKFLMLSNFPKFSKMLKMKFFPDSANEFFKDLVLGTMKHRQDNDIIRPDMIQLLMDAKKGKLNHDNNEAVNEDAGFATVDEAFTHKSDRAWSDSEIISQAVLFFIAGFETVASTMSFLLFELAANPEIQEKLVAEFKGHEKRTNGKFDYTGIQNMKYLDMVVSELLRKWPPGVATDRICTKTYNIGKPNSNSTQDYIIKKGQSIWFPVFGLHRDPKYFPDPERFDPERFSDENKHNIEPFSYIPFGTGPRNCIGSRFALCEVKAMVYQLLLHMEVSPSKKTQLPIKLSTKTPRIEIAGGYWLNLRPRT